ncbi:zinc finger domain-containing protein [Candidatus Altiarchaeota archaeon]
MVKKCSSCGVEITEKYAEFKCPKCGKSTIIRCPSCRTLGTKYSCSECSFEGP